MKLTGFFHLMILVSLLVLVFSLTGYAFAAPGQSAEQLFQHGNDLYGRGDYQQALHVYGSIATEDGISGPLLYNMANCFAQLGQTGMAIVNYERALRLSPGDSDIRGNLNLIKKNQGLFQEQLPAVRRIIAFFDLDQWTMLAGIFFVTFTFVGLAGLRFSNGKHLRLWIGGISLLLFLLAATGTLLQYRQLDAAVIISDDVRLLLSPFPSASSIGSIREGRIVEYQSQHGNYSLVEDQAGRSGWIESKDIAFINQFPVPDSDRRKEKR